MPVVRTGNRIEIAQHHPQAFLVFRILTQGMVDDIPDFLCPETVSVPPLLAFFLQFGVFQTIFISKRISMDRHDVQTVSPQGNRRQTGAVHHLNIPFSDHTLDEADGKFGGNHLRETISFPGENRIFVTISPRQDVPVVRQVELFSLGHLLVDIRAVAGLRFTPDADIRIHGLDKVHKIDIIIALVRPHTVLDIPIEHAYLLPVPLTSGQGPKRQHQE